MAEKQDYSQSELFSSDDPNGQAKAPVFRNPFSLQIRGYEKVMLLVMGLVLTGIVSFSLGVEKGKRVEWAKNNAPSQRGFTILAKRLQKTYVRCEVVRDTLLLPTHNEAEFPHPNLEELLKNHL